MLLIEDLKSTGSPSGHPIMFHEKWMVNVSYVSSPELATKPQREWDMSMRRENEWTENHCNIMI